jgi:hypothetical protein
VVLESHETSYIVMMKQIAALLIFILGFSGIIVGQTYQDFPLDESATWRVDHGGLYNGCWVSDRLHYHVAGDTVFNGKLYSIINHEGISWSQPGESTIGCWGDTLAVSGVHGYLRAENGVYYVGSSSGEGLLFDFTLNAGDTLFSDFSAGYPIVIDSTDTVCFWPSV